MSKIEWLHRPGTKAEVWNPVTGCTKVSAGCKHCYAERLAERFWPTQYMGVQVQTGPSASYNRPRAFTDVRTHEDRLDLPLRWSRPRTVFVNSMSDLFHEAVPDEFIGRVFAVMALCPQHTFIVLTKRPERMQIYFSAVRRWTELVAGHAERVGLTRRACDALSEFSFPLLNLWLGVSVEDQRTADLRIAQLFRTPACVRVVSAEPLLGPVNLTGFLSLNGKCFNTAGLTPSLDWLIVGGDSGLQARPCDVTWVRSAVQQARAAGVPAFVKQLGANVVDRNDAGFEGDKPGAWPMDTRVEDFWREADQGAPVRVRLCDRKGGDMTEWPADLRVREWPL